MHVLLSCSFVWFMSPEFDLDSISHVSKQMRPALQLFYIHNGHMPDQDFEQLRALSPDLPLVGMAPHVASYVTHRMQQGQPRQQEDGVAAAAASTVQEAAPSSGLPSTAEWLLPTWPYEPQQPCSLVRLCDVLVGGNQLTHMHKYNHHSDAHVPVPDLLHDSSCRHVIYSWQQKAKRPQPLTLCTDVKQVAPVLLLLCCCRVTSVP